MQLTNTTTANPPTQQEPDMFTSNVSSKPRPGNLLKMKSAGPTPQQMDETSQNFEAQFISQMVGSMFSTVEEDKETGGGEAAETYKSFLADEYGKIITKAGGIGVSDQVKKEMLKIQEAENNRQARSQ